MQLTSPAFGDGEAIPSEYAFCVPDPETTATLGPNHNPALSWADLPDGTKSLVLICFDRSAPHRATVEEAEGEVPPDVERPGFYHWVLVDLAPDGAVEEGAYSGAVVAGGKPSGEGPGNVRQGLNDYTGWFAGDPDMEGDYFGYDGPCPPPVDSVVHEYVFTLYATDLERCPVEGPFTGDDVLAAIDGHVLGSASLTGTYVLNPRLR